MNTTDPWVHYVEARDRLIELLRSLSAEHATRQVPLTPDWTVTAVASHLCGMNADVASGMREGLGTDERTRHQVAIRAGHSPEDICAEWLGYETAMRHAMACDEDLGRRLTADLIVHLHDIQHALGLPIDRDDQATNTAAHTYASIAVERLTKRCEIGLTIELTDGNRFEATTAPNAVTLVLRATPYDLLRSVTGRRSRRQVEALDWTGDPTAALDDLSPYGPLRLNDAGV